MSKLVLNLPDGTTLDIPLDRQRVTIGRRADNDVCLPYPAVSGEHAAVVTILEDSFLEDLNSTNGTLVNGRTIAKHFLRDGDEIDIGRQTLVYRAKAPVAQGDDAAVKSGRTLHDPRVHMPPTGSIQDPPARRPELAPGSADSTPRAPAKSQRMSAPPDERGEFPERAPLPGHADAPSIPASHERSVTHPIAEKRATTPTQPAEARPAEDRAPQVHVTTGPSAGRIVLMTDVPLVIGRVGEALVAVRRVDHRFRLVRLEGDGRVTVNGATVPAEGAELVSGDTFEVAGTRLRFSTPD